jgi:phosphatidate cytidylyltransferase
MGKLGNLGARVAVAVVAVPILVYAIYQPRHEIVWGLVFLASLIAMYEFFAMTLSARTDRLVSLFLGAVCAAGFYWLPPDVRGIAALLGAGLPAMLYYLFRFGDLGSVAARLAFTTTGIVYAGIAFSMLAFIKRDFGPSGPPFLILVLATAWLSDTGGYFAGKAFGKRKLYPTISPNKTWAGAIGGVLGSVVGAIVIKLWLMPPWVTWVDVMLVAVPGSILGQLGDLAESMIKRSVGVKDSGQILPGHGGILDRVDAVLFIAPYVYLYQIVRAALM